MPDVISPELLAEFQKLAIIFLLFVLAIWILFANTIKNTLKLISKENQAILPNQAWFLVVPFFNIYWNFEVARRLSYSLNNEFFDRKIPVEENPSMSAGMTYAWSFLVYNFPFPVFWKMLGMIVSFVYFITYWFKINQYRNLLLAHNKWRESQQNNQANNED
ncbi:hypothetical protein GQF61_08355 [Sphingobacterium sp. DK4209]|uniref:DUF4328 domain-containing protein n=1 Tax=Sphingobacterium zhuxiongii TaxID=2662364 RepID=A0A5Q0QEU4_9SPHI|nr:MULTISPECIES: hypothetical protein [unclassified Sphingobacterium]MVZ65869.1 hypothetical protein [Sphingobacterium sp. DK4209]QGA28116.1 hypothetical protein GFH32_18080 [Sphingobacterium sp. dk4302]